MSVWGAENREYETQICSVPSSLKVRSYLMLVRPLLEIDSKALNMIIESVYSIIRPFVRRSVGFSEWRGSRRKRFYMEQKKRT